MLLSFPSSENGQILKFIVVNAKHKTSLLCVPEKVGPDRMVYPSINYSVLKEVVIFKLF